MLQLAFEKQAKSFVYLSSMEVYGAIEEKYLAEQDLGFIDPLAVRSCYPESKRMCENLCVSYVSEYNVPAKICRLAQTFGRGVDIEKDVRVLSYFLRCAKENTDIELKTLGKSKRMCLYTMDAVAALLIILLKGEPGKAYNAANEETYSSILETAELVKNEIAETEIEIKYPRIVSEEALHNYPPEYKIRLNCGALCELGWKARYSMIDILRRSM